METNTLDQRRHFVRDVESGQWTMSELCELVAASPDRPATSGETAMTLGAWPRSEAMPVKWWKLGRNST